MTLYDLQQMDSEGHAIPGVLAFFTYLWIATWRRTYAEEREYPEYIDLGGEA